MWTGRRMLISKMCSLLMAKSRYVMCDIVCIICIGIRAVLQVSGMLDEEQSVFGYRTSLSRNFVGW